MKIISKYKDYYDFKVQKYGIDETRILDRREGLVYDTILLQNNVIQLAVCDTLYTIGYDNNMNMLLGDELRTYVYKHCHSYVRAYGLNIHYKPIKTDLNIKRSCPIIMISRGFEYEFPKLKNLKFNKILDADNIYIELEAWLGRQKDNVHINEISDLLKCQNAGFDKNSFRNLKNRKL